MSSIPTKQIDGDVSVGRNVSAGGNANIQGNARVGHNLKVEGWLEAKNVKGVNKGLFASVTALREAYPHPHDGWFAGVSASEKDISDLGLTVQQGKALFRMYVGCGGDWVCEPINKLYEIVVDNEQVDNLREDLSTLRGEHENLEARVDGHDTEIDNLREDLSTLRGEHENLEARVDGHDTEISGIKTQQSTLGNSIDTLTNDLSALGTRISSAEQSIKNAKADADAKIKAVTDSKGEPGGIAALDASGKVPSSQLPGYVDDVVEFNATVSGITIQAGSCAKKSTDAGCRVVYNGDSNTFVLAVNKDAASGGESGESGNTPDVADAGDAAVLSAGVDSGIIDGGGDDDTSIFDYYSNWIDADSFGGATGSGRKPESGKVYICTSENKTYHWSGSRLVVIGTDLSLGYTASTAFPGDEGRVMKQTLAQVEDAIRDLTARLVQLRTDIGILRFDGILYDMTDVVRPGLDGVYYGAWNGVFVRITPRTDDPSIVDTVVALEEYNLMSGGTAVHASEDILFRMGNRLYRYDAESNTLIALDNAGDGGTGCGTSCCAPISNGEIDNLIDSVE